jgi:hypothetical protein
MEADVGREFVVHPEIRRLNGSVSSVESEVSALLDRNAYLEQQVEHLRAEVDFLARRQKGLFACTSDDMDGYDAP